MILLALGANIAGQWGTPRQTLERTLGALEAAGLRVVRRSTWIQTRPYGVTSQPDFVNGVVALTGHLPPEALLANCQHIERAAGRRAGRRWRERVCDIDILDWCGVVRPAPGRLILPHPGIGERAFVLEPLNEIAPRWHHPVTGLTPAQMLHRVKSQEGSVVGAVRGSGR